MTLPKNLLSAPWFVDRLPSFSHILNKRQSPLKSAFPVFVILHKEADITRFGKKAQD